MVEILGIIASVLVAIAFFMNGEQYIRAANIIGSAVFIVYGILMSSISIIFLNVVSIVVNAIKIYKLKRRNNNEKNDNPYQ